MDDEIRRKRLATVIKWGVGVVGAVLVSPILFFALKGLLGVAALAVAGAVGYIAIELAPWFGMKVAYWKVKLIVAEATRNPIETMRNVYLEKSKIIKDKDEKIVQFEGRIGDYHDKLTVFTKGYPDEAARFQEVESKMRRKLALMKRKQSEAKAAQAEYKMGIEKAEAIYQMALAAHDVSELGADIEREVFMDIKQQVAFDAVNHKFNTAVAALSVEVDTEEEYKALPEARPAEVIDVTPITTKEAVPIPRRKEVQ